MSHHDPWIHQDTWVYLFLGGGIGFCIAWYLQ